MSKCDHLTEDLSSVLSGEGVHGTAWPAGPAQESFDYSFNEGQAIEPQTVPSAEGETGIDRPRANSFTSEAANVLVAHLPNRDPPTDRGESRSHTPPARVRGVESPFPTPVRELMARMEATTNGLSPMEQRKSLRHK